jgi:hypothetical protein
MVAAPAGPRDAEGLGLTRVEGATLSILLTLASIELINYRFGDSNQGITVPILKRLMDSRLYPGDLMVATAEDFPTVFHRALALVLPGPDAIAPAFFALYVLCVAAALAGVYRIGRWCGGGAAGLLAVLIAFPVRVGLANEALYRPQFSHSHLASAIAIWAIVWFLEGRRTLPLLVLSLAAYNHVLYSVYVLVPLLLVVLAERREAGSRRTLQHFAAGVVPLLPFLLWSLGRRVPMTAEWLAQLRLRSAHHSFPGEFGASLPTAACLLALGMLAASRLSRQQRLLIASFLAGVALFFVLGTLFTEYLPVKMVLQLQPHRSWRFLMLLLYGLAAAGVVSGARAGGLSRLAAVVTGILLLDPRLEPLLPLAVFLQAVLGRPVASPWAQLLAAVLLLGLGAWTPPPLPTGLPDYPLAELASGPVLFIAALGLTIVAGMQAGAPARGWLAAASAVATLLWLGPGAYDRKRPKWEKNSWRDVQEWVRQNTPRAAVLVTPPMETGFRVFSERTIVGEWKDGTQQYFSDAFTREWALRMEAVGPEGYAKLADEDLVMIARRFGASYVVIPPRRRHDALTQVYANPHYVVYAVPPR